MKRIRNFMTKPCTWGGYCKLCGAVLAFYAVVCGWILYKDKVVEKFKSLKEKVFG